MSAPPPPAAPRRPLLRTAASAEIFTRIITHGPVSRIEVGRLTGLSPAKVTKTVSPLIRDGFVTVGEHAESSSPGRPVYPLSVVPRSMLAIGIKVNADELVGVAVSIGNEVLTSVRRPLARHDPDTVVAEIVRCARRLVDKLGDSADRLVGLGVSVSGEVDTASGVVRHSPLLGWSHVPLGARVARQVDLPVIVENDVRALTKSEQWFGLGVEAESFAIVTIGAGIGCGISVNRDVLVGAHGVVGEIGHLPLAPPDALCVCGRRGCVEAVASSGAIRDAVRAGHGDPTLTLADAVTLAHDGDRTAVDAFDRAGTAIGAALAVTVNLVDPEVVVIAGEGVMEYDLYERRIREEFAAHAFGAAASCRLVVRRHTFIDWACGAAVAAFRDALRPSSA
ncbi:ROK family protein [Promicromonospora sp. NPDC050880]|uniref:ROK family protein n=1 Tax=Promicromonospora sp. NPDC050880 TaxID=3364406 RepID=UPI0037981A52